MPRSLVSGLGLLGVSPGAALLAALAVGSLAPQRAQGQEIQSPVYLDDAPAAAAGLEAIGPLVARQNFAEAARTAQRVLDDDAERLLPSVSDPGLWVPVREHVHRVLRAAPELLAAYRRAEEAPAARALSRGDWRGVERARLLTPAGHEAALRVAQELFEAAQFDAALRVLAQLIDHPDRAGPGGRIAAALAAQAAAHASAHASASGASSPAPDARAWSVAEALALHAGIPAPARTTAQPPPGLAPAPITGLDAGWPAWQAARSLTDPDAAADSLALLPPEPLASAPLTPDALLGPPEDLAPSVRSIAQPAWVLPTAAGDVVYTNDGLTVAARDRFTLRPLWTFTASGVLDDDSADEWERLSRRRFTHVLEDTGTVTLAGDSVLATTGRATSGRRAGDGRLHRLDRGTGRVLWSVDPALLAPDLAELSIRGAPCVVGDTVVVVGRKNIRARRLLSVWMVGLDLSDGSLRWARPLASAGALPFQQFNLLSEAPLAAGGVVYAADDLGVVAAVDAALGRTLWARPFTSDPARTNERVAPWNTSVPILTDAGLVLMSPDRRELLVLDERAGTLRAKRDAGELGSPFYLARVGDFIACVGALRTDFLDADDPARSRPRATRLTDQPSIMGRVGVAGRHLVVPVSGGVELIDPEQPETPRRVTLARTGNAIVVDGQLLVVDDATIHSFLTWDSAAPLLRRRSAESPGDAAAPIALAELAERSGRAAEAIEAADLAAAAAERTPDQAPRVFDALLGMVHNALPEASPAPVRRDGNSASIEPAGDAAPSGLGSLDAAESVLERVERTARVLPDDAARQAAVLLARGVLHEARGRAGPALTAYHGVLADAALAASSWRGPRVSVRADVEARRRIELLVRATGPEPARAFDAPAAQAASALGDRHDASTATARAAELERLASVFPVAGITPALWRDAADLHAQAGQDLAVLRAARAGLRACELRPDAPDALTLAGDLLGHLTTALTARGRGERAGQEIARLRAIFGEALVPTRSGVPMAFDAGALASGQVRLPRVGPVVASDTPPIVLPGRALEPLTPAARTDTAVLIAPGLGGGSVLAVRVEDGGPPRVLWTRPAPVPASPVLVRLDEAAAVLLWPRTHEPGDAPVGNARVDGVGVGADDPANAVGAGRGANGSAPVLSGLSGGFFEAIALDTGATLWTAPAFDSAVRPRRAAAADPRATLPDGTATRADDMLVLVEGATAVLVERTGRLAAYDLRDGRAVWAADAPVGSVTDAAIGGGYVVLAGRMLPGGGAGGGGGGTGASGVGGSGAAVLDALSGRLVHSIESLNAPPRWVRATPEADAFIGLVGSVLALGLDDAQVRWIAADEQIASTDDAWIVPGPSGDQLLISDTDAQLWALDAATGRMNPAPVETYGVHTDRTSLRVAVAPASHRGTGDTGGSPPASTPARTLLSSGAGVVVLSPDGTIVGSDAIGADAALLPAAMGHARMVVIEPDPLWRRPELAVHTLDYTSARVLGTTRVALPADARLVPESCSLLDGWALVGFGGVSLALPMPARDAAP